MEKLHLWRIHFIEQVKNIIIDLPLASLEINSSNNVLRCIVATSLVPYTIELNDFRTYAILMIKRRKQ